MHASEGTAGFLTDRDARDYAEVIGWAAAQSWCTGAVGVNGVSYLCMSQWRVAALRPPGLKAIVAWEGASDLLREFAYHGGIPETGFLPVWWKNRMLRGSHRGATMGEDFLIDARTHPLDDAYWQAKRPDLAAIDVPALVAAGWADHGLHTRGTLLAYEALRGPKWHYIHGGRKWETYYRAESLELQRQFLDHFLKGSANGFQRRPTVTYQVRRSREAYQTRTATDWPPPSQQHRTLYLDAASMSLIAHSPTHPSSTTYASSRRRRRTDRATPRAPWSDSTVTTASLMMPRRKDGCAPPIANSILSGPDPTGRFRLMLARSPSSAASVPASTSKSGPVQPCSKQVLNSSSRSSATTTGNGACPTGASSTTG